MAQDEMDPRQRHLQAIRDAYKKAEDAIHALGLDGEGVDTAAINELRYAGYHVLRAITTGDTERQTEELSRAQRHCERAFYEAYDGAVFYYLQWNKSPRPAMEFQNAGDLMFFFMRPAPLPQSG